MAKRDNITQARLKEVLVYDELKGLFTRKIDRGRWKKGSAVGTDSLSRVGKKYLTINIDYIIYGAHRLAFLYMTGRFPKDQVDHIDGNGLNNKWGNLREVTNHENKLNRRKSITNSSGVVGVFWREDLKKWRATIQYNKKMIHLGVFSDKDDAINTRKNAEIKYGFHVNNGQTRPL